MQATALASQSARKPREFDTRNTLLASLLGGVVGAFGNLAVYFLAKAAGVPFAAKFDPNAGATSLPVVMVAVSSVVPAIGAALLLLGLNAWVSRPARVFVWVATVFLVLSMGGPLTLQEASGGTKFALGLMHVVSGAAIVGFVLSRGRARH